MAITKIISVNYCRKGDKAQHLKNSLDYIMRVDKMGSECLVGSVNCLPENAYEQMVMTKQMFEKEGGRQAYHIVISLEKGEGTPQMVFKIAKGFVERFLGEDYEVVYTVHTDKKHLHAHILYNNVNMVTGYKYQYRKGDWKYKMQPITNELCEKFKLGIMPAEYSKESKNVSRKDWEKEHSWKRVIEDDVIYCRGVAENMDHFLYLLEELGYEVKSGVHIAVKTDKMKRFRRIDTIQSEFSKEELEGYIQDNKYKSMMPKVITPDVTCMYQPKNEYQRKFFTKIYRMRVVEKQRFTQKSARYKEDLERMHLLQEEYLLLHRKNITSRRDLAVIIEIAELNLQDVSRKQKELYRLRANEKRSCKTEDELIRFLEGEEEYRSKLAELKEKKKTIQREAFVAKRCLVENLHTGLFVPENVEIGNIYDVEVPELPTYLRKKEQVMTKPIIVDYYKKEEDIEAVIQEDIKEACVEKVMTKAIYESMSDIEKARFIGIDITDISGSIRHFHNKLAELDMGYKNHSDEAEEFLKLDSALRKEVEGREARERVVRSR